ncbi:cell cycle checkpoint control protein RAD9A [Lucilia cuprina]|uniref:cell cycle checkpoint control protein RAD9A n=1 Tax=Lucilia cuprina TaxID=7375 RepID=UPI001F05DB2B|nr:cell cycle checkpoint control protein RAD9A [Lucilia cuprina]
MKCSLEGMNAKAIAKSIQSLAKIGSDLCVEADENGLQFRTFNPSKSAMATIRFQRIFFETYSLEESGVNYCKVCMKAILAVFKNMRHVERCEIRLLADQLKLQVQFKCSLETMKNALISVVDDEILTTNVSQDEAINVIVGSYKIFNDISSNFNATESEITLESMGNCLTAKNYIEGARVNDKFMRSQLKLSPSEFETYSIQEESAITFSLKEFRAFLAFAETINENITLNFSQEGSPLFVTMKKTDYIECSLVMTTVLPEDVSFYEECLETEVSEPAHNTTRKSNTSKTHKRKHSNSNVNSTSAAAAKKRLSEETTLSNDTTIFDFDGDNNHTSLHSIQAARNLTQRDHDMLDDNDILLAAAALDTPDLSFQDNKSEDRDNEEEEEDETIPQSPQREHVPKIRTIFARCFEATYIPKEPSPNSEVFVPNSDTED